MQVELCITVTLCRLPTSGSLNKYAAAASSRPIFYIVFQLPAYIIPAVINRVGRCVWSAREMSSTCGCETFGGAAADDIV